MQFYAPTLKQKGVSYSPPLITPPTLCKLWTMRQQLPGAPSHPETASSTPLPPQPIVLSALPNFLTTDHPILPSPSLLPVIQTPVKLGQKPLATLSTDLHIPPTGGQVPHLQKSPKSPVQFENVGPCSPPFPHSSSRSTLPSPQACLQHPVLLTSLLPPRSQGSEIHRQLPRMPRPAPYQRLVGPIESPISHCPFPNQNLWVLADVNLEWKFNAK